MSSIVATLELSHDWDPVPEMMEEELSATSSEEASKVLEAWQTDDEDSAHDDLMDVDDDSTPIASFDDDIFFDSAVSSPQGVDELVFESFGETLVERFSVPLLETNDSSLSFEERYKATLKKLAESMQRSKETRKSLKIQTPKTEEYERRMSVHGVLTSIEKSSEELHGYMVEIQQTL